MPQFSNMVLKDHADVDHTFKPRDVKSGVARWVEGTGIPAGDRSVTLSAVSTQNGRMKATMKMVLPVVQDSLINGVSKPVVVRTAYADLTFNFDALSPSVERTDAIAFVRHLLEVANTQSTPVLVDGEGVY